MKRVRLTVIGATGAEYSVTIPVDDGYELPLVNMDDWVVIEGSDGSAAMVPPQRVVGIYVEAAPKKEHKGGRVN